MSVLESETPILDAVLKVLRQGAMQYETLRGAVAVEIGNVRQADFLRATDELCRRYEIRSEERLTGLEKNRWFWRTAKL